MYTYKPELLLIISKLWSSWESKTFLKSSLKSTVTLPVKVWVHPLWLKRGQITLTLLLRVLCLFSVFNFWLHIVFSYHKRYLYQTEKKKCQTTEFNLSSHKRYVFFQWHFNCFKRRLSMHRLNTIIAYSTR